MSTHEIMSKIDDIKEKLSNQDYIDLCNLLKIKSEKDHISQLYKVKYLKQEMKLINLGDELNTPINDIISKHETVICKIEASRFISNSRHESYINDFIEGINDHSDLYMRYTFEENTDDGITRLIFGHPAADELHYADLTSVINNEIDYDTEEINCQVRFKKYLIYSIEKVD